MIKKIGKQPLRANVHDFGSFMYKNQGILDKLNDFVYGVGNYLNARDTLEHLAISPAAITGMGYDSMTKPIVFTPLTGKGIQYMKPEGYIEDEETEDKGLGYNLIAEGAQKTSPVEGFNSGDFGGPIYIYDAGGWLNAGAGALKLGTDATNNYASKSAIKDVSGIYTGINNYENTRFGGSNENLLEQYASAGHYNPLTGHDLQTGSSHYTFGDFVQSLGASYEGLKGGSGLGPVGQVVGGIVGGLSSTLTSIFGRNKAKRRARRAARELNQAGTAANAFVAENFADAAEGNDEEQGWNALFNYGSMNAGLGTAYQGALGGRLFDEGGFMGNHGTVWDTGLNYFKTGGTHEENPNGGILQGYDSQGTPNLVEEGEYKWTDDKYGFGEYIFSNRLMIPQEIANKYKLGGTAKKDVTFAQGIQKYLKDNGVEDMENDPIQQDTTGEFLATMATVQEQVRIQEQIKQFIEELKKMPPEQQRQALEQLQQLAIQQQLQAMQEQQAMQLVEQQQQAMQQPMEQSQEQVPQEMPLEAPQEQMVQDSGQPMMEEQGQTLAAPQAYGGRIFAGGGNTMMENQGYEKLTDEDKEAIENQKRQQMQEDATRAQRQEEESEEERLDDQIDQIIEYAKETYNKELLVGARKAQRGNIEEKKAFIERASLIMETERQQQQQTAAQQDQQQNAEMQAKLQQEAQQPLPGEVPQEDMGINAMAYGGRMNTFAQGGSPGPGNEFNEWALTIYPGIDWTQSPSDTDRFKYNLIRKALGLIYNDINNNRGNTVRGAFNDTIFLKTFKNSPLELLANKGLWDKKLEDITPLEWGKLIDTYYEELNRFNAQWKKAYGEDSVPPPYFERYNRNYRAGTEKAYKTVLNREEEDNVRSETSYGNNNKVLLNTITSSPTQPVQPVQPIDSTSQEVPPTQLNTSDRDAEAVNNMFEEIKELYGHLDYFKKHSKLIKAMLTNLRLQHVAQKDASKLVGDYIIELITGSRESRVTSKEETQKIPDDINQYNTDERAKDEAVKIAYHSIVDSFLNGENAEIANKYFEENQNAIKESLRELYDNGTLGSTGELSKEAFDSYVASINNKLGITPESTPSTPVPDNSVPTATTETTEPQKERVRNEREANRILLNAYGRRGYNELTDEQKDMLREYVMYADGDLKNANANQYDHVLGRLIIDPKNLFDDAPKVTMYDALESDEAKEAFNAGLRDYLKAGEWDPTYWKDQQALTDFYRDKYTKFINKIRNKNYTYKPGQEWDGNTGIADDLEKEFLTGKEARQFYNELMQGDALSQELARLLGNMWVDDQGKPLGWKDTDNWEFNNAKRSLNGKVVESHIYKRWANSLKGKEQSKKLDALLGIGHDPNGVVGNGREIQYYLNDTSYNAKNRLGIDPTAPTYSAYYAVADTPNRITDPDSGKEIWRYNVTPKNITRYINTTYKNGKPVYRLGSEEEMKSEGFIPYKAPEGMETVESPDLPGYKINNVFYTPKLGEKGSNDKILEGIEGILNNVNLQELPQFLYQLSHPANQSYYNMALRQWDRVPMMATSHLGNYVAPQYVDINSMNNKAMSLGLQGIQAALNISNGNVGSLNYNTQLANYMMQQGLADNLIKGTQWNAEQQQKAAAHNTEKVDTPNIANDLAVAKQNQDAMIARAQAYPAVADKMTENEASWHQGMAQGIGRIANGNDQLLSNSEYRKIINALIQDLGLA